MKLLSRNRAYWTAILLLFLSHIGLCLYGACIHSPAFDEPAHLASGVLNLQNGNYEPYRVNPPLYRQLAALPVLLHGYVPLRDQFSETTGPGNRSEMHAGQAFSQVNQDDYHHLLVLGRLSGIAWSCLGAWIAFLWCRELGGYSAGIVALAIWCFEPNLIAHAQILGPDVPAASAGLLAGWYFRRFLIQPSWTNLAFAGLTLGIALLTKFTLLVLVPVWLMLLLAIRQPTGPMTWKAWARRGFQTLTAALIAQLVILTDYEFTKIGTPLGEFQFISKMFRGDVPDQAPFVPVSGNRFHGTILEKVPFPLPADYLYGIDVQWYDFDKGRRSRSSFLAGEMKAGGWWYYYLYCMAIKTPLGLLLLMLGGIVYGLIQFRNTLLRREALLLILPSAAIFTLVSSQTGFNHHGRYVLPALPFLIIGAGWVSATLLQRSYWSGALVAGCLLWGIGSHLCYYPHSLSYFNELVGGPKNGYHHLIDSNIDWGQDLILLERWQAKHPDRPLKYALFTVARPEDYGLRNGPANFACARRWEDREKPPEPGWYAISVSILQGRPNNNGQLPEHVRQILLDQTPADRAGYSILIFHLTGPGESAP